MVENSLVRELRAVCSPHAEAIAQGLATGTMRIEESKHNPSVPALLATYRVRRDHLSRFGTDHGRSLFRDVSNLCEQLESATAASCTLLVVRTSTAGEIYTVFYDSQSGRVFGCCHVFSKLDQSPEEWEKLWKE